jgi:hypothetical protein
MSNQKLVSLLLDAVDLVHQVLKEPLASEEVRLKLMKWRQEADQALFEDKLQ